MKIQKIKVQPTKTEININALKAEIFDYLLMWGEDDILRGFQIIKRLKLQKDWVFNDIEMAIHERRQTLKCADFIAHIYAHILYLIRLDFPEVEATIDDTDNVKFRFDDHTKSILEGAFAKTKDKLFKFMLDERIIKND